jgi:hypothetical protein
MTARTSRTRWLLSETAYVYKLGVLAAFGVSVAFYFGDWPRLDLRAKAPSAASETAPKPGPAAYTGSIITVPMGTRDDCEKVDFDNRTGAMWDAGVISCNTLVTGPIIVRGQSTIERMRSIGRAFNGKQD